MLLLMNIAKLSRCSSFMNIFLSGIHFILVFLLSVFGIFLLGIAISESLRFSLIEVLLYTPRVFLSLGIGLSFLGLLLFIGLAFFHRRSELRLKMEPHSVVMQGNLIASAIEKYWKKNYPLFSLAPQIFTQRNKLDIVLFIAPFDEAKRKEFLLKIEKDLAKLLSDFFGYDREFRLTLSPL